MKSLFITLFIGVFSVAFAQRELKEYKAQNGMVYKIGDTIRFAYGSGKNQVFEYVFRTGISTFNIENLSSIYVDSTYVGKPVVIKSIEIFKQKGREKILFLVQGKGAGRFDVHIDSAIANKEITSYYDTLFYKKLKPAEKAKQILNKANVIF